MKISRSREAIVVESHGGLIQTLADARVAYLLGKDYARSVVEYAAKNIQGNTYAEFRTNADNDYTMSYLVQMALTWNRFAGQLLLHWITFGLLGRDRLVFIMEKQP